MSIDKTVVAILLGDGHVTTRGRISLHHGIAQKDYLLYKVGILNDNGFKMRVYEVEHPSYGEIRKFIKADGYCSNKSKQLRDLLYPNGVKEVPSYFSDAFDFRDWSFIYMDDGRANTLSHTNNLIGGVRTKVSTDKFVNRYEICTESFDDTSNKLLMENLLEKGVESYISKRNRIIIKEYKIQKCFITLLSCWFRIRIPSW